MLRAQPELAKLNAWLQGFREKAEKKAAMRESRTKLQLIVTQVDGVDAVLHCAARSLVGESMADPGLYYRVNVAGGVSLLESMRAGKIVSGVG